MIQDKSNDTLFDVITIKTELKYNVFVGITLKSKPSDIRREFNGFLRSGGFPVAPTIDREFAPLLEIRDHHPKYVLTMDNVWHDNIEGIHHKHIADFLLMETL